MAPKELSDATRYLTYNQAAEILGVSRMEIYNKVRAGQLRDADLSSTGTRRQPRVVRSSLDDYCARLDGRGLR